MLALEYCVESSDSRNMPALPLTHGELSTNGSTCYYYSALLCPERIKRPCPLFLGNVSGMGWPLVTVQNPSFHLLSREPFQQPPN